MPEYTIRILRPDDSVAGTIDVDLGSDSDCWTHLVENYRSKAAEVWRGDQRVTRRVSGWHEVRSKGYLEERTVSVDKPFLLSASREFERKHGIILRRDVEVLETAAQAIFSALREVLAPHPIWVRSWNHPRALPAADNRARFTFSVGHMTYDTWHGGIHITVWSLESSGPDIVNDYLELIDRELLTMELPCRENVGLRLFKDSNNGWWNDGVRDGIYLTGRVTMSWVLNRAPPRARFQRDNEPPSNFEGN